MSGRSCCLAYGYGLSSEELERRMNVGDVSSAQVLVWRLAGLLDEANRRIYVLEQNNDWLVEWFEQKTKGQGMLTFPDGTHCYPDDLRDKTRVVA